MESITIFLAQLWGPVVLALGVGIYINRSHYKRIYYSIEKEPLALLLFGMAGMAVGITHIQAHNVWGSLSEILISLFGWVLLIKAATFLIKPNVVDQWGDKVATSKLIQVATFGAIALGAYLTWVGYFAA